MLRGGFVIPDVSAVTEAAAVVIAGAFESVELAVGGTEAGLGNQRGEGGHGRIARTGRKGTVAHGSTKRRVRASRSGQFFGGIFGRLPRSGEALRVMIADDGVLVAFGRGPAGPGRRAIGEMPGKQKSVGGFGSGRDLLLQAERTDGLAIGRFGAKLAVGAEIVPEEQRASPPFGIGPAAEVGELAFGLDEPYSDRARLRVIGGQAGVAHQEALKMLAFAIFDHALFAGMALGDVLIARADQVLDRPGDGYAGGLLAGIVDPVAKDGDGQSGLFRIERNERAESFEGDIHGQAGIVKRDLGDWKFAGEGGAFETAEPRGVLRPEAVRPFVGRHQAGFENVSRRLAVAGLRPDGCEGIFGRAAFVGAVEDFPIAELSASAEADAAGAHATERHGEHGKLTTGEDARVAHGGSGERNGRLGGLDRRFRGRCLGGSAAGGQRDGLQESAAASGFAHLVRI